MLRTFLSTQNARLDDDSQSHGSSHPAKTIVSVSNSSLYTLNYQPHIYTLNIVHMCWIYLPFKGLLEKNGFNQPTAQRPLCFFPRLWLGFYILSYSGWIIETKAGGKLDEDRYALMPSEIPFPTNQPTTRPAVWMGIFKTLGK